MTIDSEVIKLGALEVGVVSVMGGGGNPLDELFANGELGDYWDLIPIANNTQDTSRTTPVTAVDDPIGNTLGLRGTADLTQATTAEKPLWKDTAGAFFDTLITDDQLTHTFSSAFGSVTIAARVHLDSTLGSGRALFGMGTNSSNRIDVKTRSGTNIRGTVRRDGVSITTSEISYGSTGVYNILFYHDVDANVAYLEIQSVANTTRTNVTTNGTIDELVIGNDWQKSTCLNDNIERAFCINRALTDSADRDLVWDFLSNGV
jgi:hypothetical protein